MIEAKDILFKYKKKSKFTLKCSSFIAKPSEITCIIGSNGGGKSTLLKVLGGLVNLKYGTINLEKKELNKYSIKGLHHLIGWIDASISLSLVENLFVKDHLALAFLAAGEKIPFFYRYLDISSNNKLFKYLKDIKNNQIGKLSSGQRQNLTIVIAQLLRKKIILADESTSNLDIFHSKQFFITMKEISESNDSSIVIVTHDILLASEFADSLYYVKDGIVDKIDIDKKNTDDRIKICKSIIFDN